ncbi:MAG: pilus assembly protein, partial [Cryobacterium sp.]|nr:pilus assembly protein [Cryobacterium sp.]
FALVVPILLLLVFGIIDYGAVYADSISARNGVREAARQGVVSNFNGGTSLAGVATAAQSNIGAISGTASAKAYAPNGWVKGKPLVVCAEIPNPGIIRFVPLPSQLRARVELSIENATSPPTGAIPANSGTWASWC